MWVQTDLLSVLLCCRFFRIVIIGATVTAAVVVRYIARTAAINMCTSKKTLSIFKQVILYNDVNLTKNQIKVFGRFLVSTNFCFPKGKPNNENDLYYYYYV